MLQNEAVRGDGEIESVGPMYNVETTAQPYKLDDRFHKTDHMGCHPRFLVSHCVAATSW
jgi:hypothetical protein